jgi:hypothetical protein
MGHGHDEKPAPKQTAPAAAADQQAAAVAQPALQPMDPIDLGEQIFHSDHTFDHHAWNLTGSGPATVTSWIDGDPEIRLLDAPRQLPLVNTLVGPAFDHFNKQPFKIRFAPTDSRRRHYTGQLYIQAVWPDGMMVLKVVPITARARELDDIPFRIAPVVQPHVEPVVPPVPSGEAKVSPDVERRFSRATRDAQTAAEALAGAQLSGVALAERETESYQKPPPPHEFSWWDLVEVALQVGLAGVGGVIAQHLGTTLLKAVQGAEAVAAGAEVSQVALAGITEAVEAGINDAGRRAIASHSPEARSKTKRSGGGSSGEFSANPAINFFATQESILLDAAKKNALSVSERSYQLEPLLGTAPDVALSAMEAMTTGLDAAASSGAIINRQALATESQWIALVARQNLGETALKEYKDGTHDDVHVTDLSSARPKDPTSMPASKDGVLDLIMEFSPPRIVDARLTGVAHEVTYRLWHVTPASLGIPVRLILGGKTPAPLVITRDEAGRVRLSGNQRLLLTFVDDHTLIGSEEQAIRLATQLVDSIFTTRLEVPVLSNDATGLGS